MNKDPVFIEFYSKNYELLNDIADMIHNYLKLDDSLSVELRFPNDSNCKSLRIVDNDE